MAKLFFPSGITKISKETVISRSKFSQIFQYRKKIRLKNGGQNRMGLNERKGCDHFDPPMPLSSILEECINDTPQKGGPKEMIASIHLIFNDEYQLINKALVLL